MKKLCLRDYIPTYLRDNINLYHSSFERCSLLFESSLAPALRILVHLGHELCVKASGRNLALHSQVSYWLSDSPQVKSRHKLQGVLRSSSSHGRNYLGLNRIRLDHSILVLPLVLANLQIHVLYGLLCTKLRQASLLAM